MNIEQRDAEQRAGIFLPPPDAGSECGSRLFSHGWRGRVKLLNFSLQFHFSPSLEEHQHRGFRF